MNGIDFLRACTTNVKLVPDVLETPYTLYRAVDGGDIEETAKMVTLLRAANVLCVAIAQDLWIFGDAIRDNVNHEQALDTSFCKEREGSIGEELDREAANSAVMQDMFLRAVEGSITFALASQQGVVHIGHRQWVVTANEPDNVEDENGSLLVRLHLRLTENGSLYLSTTTHVSHLQTLTDSPADDNSTGQNIVLAPSGAVAKLLGDVAKGATQIPLGEHTIVASDAWEKSCPHAAIF